MTTAYHWQALSEDRETGSWARDGDALPFVPFRAAPGEDDSGNVVFRDTYAGSLERVDTERLDAARIDAEDVDAPSLLVAGEDDLMWPSAEHAREVADRMAADADVRTYEGAGHGVTPPHVPTTDVATAGGMALGGTPSGAARANADFWPAALDVLAPDTE